MIVRVVAVRIQPGSSRALHSALSNQYFANSFPPGTWSADEEHVGKFRQRVLGPLRPRYREFKQPQDVFPQILCQRQHVMQRYDAFSVKAALREAYLQPFLGQLLLRKLCYSTVPSADGSWWL